MYEDNNFYEAPPVNPDERGSKIQGSSAFAIVSLVLSIISLILCCLMGLNFILAIPALIFGIVSLVKRRRGKGMAIAGIIISAISILLTSMLIAIYGPIFNNTMKVAMDFDNVYTTFNETGEIPEYLEKYTDEKYDYLWKNAGYDDFYGFFDEMLDKMYQEQHK
ncbi:MAG: DUF4190 domain-containing protein [Oscillospiraceae bacterium]|nr:DUF4190 domain-containing protein [Oscillospiraceae bacterium]